MHVQSPLGPSWISVSFIDTESRITTSPPMSLNVLCEVTSSTQHSGFEDAVLLDWTCCGGCWGGGGAGFSRVALKRNGPHMCSKEQRAGRAGGFQQQREV